MRASAQAHANIALVKYWGKRNLEWNLPLAGSLSLTLDGLTTTTTVSWNETGSDRLILDGKEATAGALDKARVVLDEIRRRANIDAFAHIESANNFPTGAGLASSASGLAALTLAAARAANFDCSPEVLSIIARRGSGSACRSIFGGFVEWLPGKQEEGNDSHAVQIFPADYWDLRVVVAVIQDRAKAVNSTTGMLHTAETSPFFQPYIDTVENDITQAKKAIADRKIKALGEIAERSALRMHASMMAADPALIYLQPNSWRVIDRVKELQMDGAECFFSADAGPNVKVFCTPQAEEELTAEIGRIEGVKKIINATVGGDARVI
jgi:diphosphomevalonate decarboxylase